MASQAVLWYNDEVNIVLPERYCKYPLAWTNLIRRLIMDTLPPHTQNGKPSHIPALGIYKITCTANEKIYIGSTVNLNKRKSDHFSYLRGNRHNNPKMQRAWNKYGEQAFTFEVLELVSAPEMLIVREQYWFDALKPFGNKGFNIALEAGHRVRLGRKHTPETRAKIGIANTGNKYNVGKKATPESIERLRQSHLGKPSTFKGKRHTPEAIEKLRYARSRQQMTRESIEKARLSNTGKKRAFRPNAYRIEGDIAYITLTKSMETIIDATDLERVLNVRWHAAYNQRSKSYHARGPLQGSPVFLSRYLTGAKEGERVDHLSTITR
jgi:group I intron endonuclease